MIKPIILISLLFALSTQIELRQHEHTNAHGQNHDFSWSDINPFKSKDSTPQTPAIGCPAGSKSKYARYTSYLKFCTKSQDQGVDNPASTYGIGHLCKCYNYCNPATGETSTRQQSQNSFCYTTDDTATCLDACADLPCLPDSSCMALPGGF